MKSVLRSAEDTPGVGGCAASHWSRFGCVSSDLYEKNYFDPVQLSGYSLLGLGTLVSRDQEGL